jgi:hypothetical protein
MMGEEAKARGDAAPPMGNTGVQMTGAGLGWLQGTLPRVDPGWVIALLSDSVDEAPVARSGGNRWYSESTTVGPHVLAAWAPRTRPEAVETYFEVRQSALDGLGGAASLALAAELVEAGARMTRADAYYDDLARHAEPATVADAFRRGDMLTHIRRVRELRQYVRSAEAGDAIPDGATTYLGSSQSEAMVQVYDKAAESGRADAGVRWEIQARADRAGRFVHGAVEANDGLARYVLAAIRGLIDFRERAGDARGDRAGLLDWWAAIIGDADRVGLNGPARVDTLEQRAVWVERQVAPTLAMLVRAYGVGWLRSVLESGDLRLTERQRRLAAREGR